MLKMCEMVPKMYGMVPKMCDMMPKMCNMVPKMCGMVPEICGMVQKMCGMVTTPDKQMNKQTIEQHHKYRATPDFQSRGEFEIWSLPIIQDLTHITNANSHSQ